MICGLTITLRKHKCIITANQMTMRYNSVMYKANKETRLLIRFLREKGIRYIFIEETLRNEHRSRILNDEANGNLLKYFDKCFPRGLYNVISYSFIWDSTKNGYKFWNTVYDMWVAYNSKNLYGAENFIH